MLTSDLIEKRDRLLATVRSYGACVVAYSGGVDSALVAKAVALVWGEQAVAVTAVSASLAASERELARSVAQQIGIQQVELATNELDNPLYTQNSPDRCYHCKTELYTQLERYLAGTPAVIVNGANLDDQGDYRPGMLAASEHTVKSPLLECGFRKSDVRALAAEWDLPVWDKPASPCLSSRVAYGEEVTPERLAMIERAEAWLRRAGFHTVRVRYHKGDLARVEIPAADLPRLLAEEFRMALERELLATGFKFVTVDLAGFRSGSLNALLAEPPPALYQIANNR